MEKRPDILVAFDLGTTFTGVGWARTREDVLQSPIQIVSNWPGCSTRNEQKVQTCLVYSPGMKLSSWGFLCEDDDGNDRTRRDMFKMFLDKATLGEAQQHHLPGCPASLDEAQQLVTDYLHQIYLHIKSTIEQQTGIGPSTNWKELAVEFIFSVPTTWRSLDIVNRYKNAIHDAGFGTEGLLHKATVELTESEAAAVATIKSTAVSFRQDDIFLSVDAGGGTTDFALMEVIEARDPYPSMRQLTQVDGIGIGSTLIDRGFGALVRERCYKHPDLMQRLPPGCIEKLDRSDKFRTTKHKFGEKVWNAPVYKIPLEGVGYDFNHAAAGIEAGKFLLSKEELQSIFEPHVLSMLDRIIKQLDWLQERMSNRQVNYMILSGGLGSSTYVRERLQAELSSRSHPCAKQIKIIQAPDPQLVVVKGLLLDRMQSLQSPSGILRTRKARASYGVVCKTIYNPTINFNDDIEKDKWDDQMYALGQIKWLIKKGESIDPNSPISESFRKVIDPLSNNRAWDCLIVTSQNEMDFLPRSIKQAGVTRLCTVRSDLSGVTNSELQLRKKSRTCFFGGKKWYVCAFEVRAIIAPADLRFELLFNGQKFSRNHEPIRVSWNQEETSTSP
ncbi:hypothetical protein BD289DRAFT_12638 [Coniella lustricola]|uniref:Hsp70 family chaperone n=1 Tax=Coniella lustricola TaxID=2025994 RepID=A0A2T3A4B4_9PEZI|nr:hypothetical protein BD289DRAFT_12638 [Coniella lustricola]